MKENPIIAMVAPSLDAYSETFIQAQKKGLKGKVCYYYGGNLPLFLEGFGRLKTRFVTWEVKIKRRLGIKTFNADEIAFIQSLKKQRIQVVFAQYGPTAHRVVQICKDLKLPLITHFHGYDASVDIVIKECNHYKEVFEYSSYAIIVSNTMKSRLIEKGCPKEKLIFNPCAPDTSFLEVKPQFSEPLFIGLGRFVDKKAPYYTILAFSKVVNRFPNAKLVIGGEGELFEVCKNIVCHLKIEKNVLLPGILPREEFLAYLSKGCAFVQHSVTALNGDQEGTPVAILEASAAGLPVIATHHAGIPDVILDGETGFLIPEHDVEAMADKMILLLENKELAKQMGKKGKERIKNYFSLENHLQTLDQIIGKTIHKNE
ncbi:glycosyltransferase [Flavobacterium flavipallidum]|uniref:Glycosyltransferase n=1 Tax=Flavobacterium flavipallidum TaxID=3139140 RepID=A0ABU9HKA1_9FLAO